jgi:TolB-like protein/Tfp pilus assembly protein PilF
MSFLEELKRRNVVKVGMLYVVASWLILQVADVLFEAMNLPSVWLRLVLAILILGFPLALIFSWVFEMTPEGIKRERDIDRSSSITQQTGRKVNTLIVVLLVLAIAAVVVDRLIPETAVTGDREAAVDKRDGVTPAVESAVPVETGPVGEDASIGNDKSVAVLPFANRSANEADVYFVDGIHDDILTQLARIGDLKVISRTSVEKFRGTTQSMGEIGEALGVQNILEGGVQRAGDRVRINVQLIDVETDEHLWADTYDRELTTENIFAIQSEISTAIAEALKATLSPVEKAQLATEQTHNLEALEAYFLGRQAMAKRTSAALSEAVGHFERAIELDPNYALAYVALADSHVLLGIYSGKPFNDQLVLARPLIDTALELDDRLGEAYVSRAMLHMRDDPAAAEADFKKGVALAPGYVTGYHWYAVMLANEGRVEESLVLLSKAASLDPMSAIVRENLGDLYGFVGRFEDSRAHLEATIRIDPDFAAGYDSLGIFEVTVNGRLDRAVPLQQRAVAVDPGNPLFLDNLAQLWADLGGYDEADGLLQRMRVLGPTSNLRAIEMLLPLLRGAPYDSVLAAAERVAVENSGWNRAFATYLLALADLESGDGDRALARFREAFPELSGAAEPVIGDYDFQPALFFAWILRQRGEDVRSDLLVERSLAFMRERPRFGLMGTAPFVTYAHAVRGDKQRALAALRESIEGGWRYYWRMMLKSDPVFATLRDEPGYAEIVAAVQADIAAQLANVRAMEARGELPPLPPMPAR